MGGWVGGLGSLPGGGAVAWVLFPAFVHDVLHQGHPEVEIKGAVADHCGLGEEGGWVGGWVDGWVGVWVGGWVGGWVEERKAVRMSYCKLWVGGWVGELLLLLGGWVSTYEFSVLPTPCFEWEAEAGSDQLAAAVPGDFGVEAVVSCG